jgi:heavy metal sensor kinase
VINVRALRFRLAAWYFATVAAICGLAAAGYWITLDAALNRALDQGLRYRLLGIHLFLEDLGPVSRDTVEARLGEIARIGDLFQVYDAGGRLIAQSQALTRHDASVSRPPELGDDIRYEDGGSASFPLRLAWQRVTVSGRPVIIGVADPQRKFAGVASAFRWVLLLSLPVILLVATVCGWWLGRRTLTPVARIADDARAISERSLATRLAVPDSQDELQRLSETLNAMLDRIERSFTRNRQFTADASHELRAPMTLIHTAAQFALRKERSRDDLVDSLQKILAESTRMAALIDDLLTLARGDAGHDGPERAVVDTAPLLRDVVHQAASMAASRDVRVDVRLQARTLPVRAHEAHLRRVLVILVDNAVKYTPAGGLVTVSGMAGGATVVLSVSDTGIGIAPDDLPHVFERFWRADKVRSRQAGGTGLGLAIAKQIAEQHGAELSVESDAGHGATFTLRLPMAPS